MDDDDELNEESEGQEVGSKESEGQETNDEKSQESNAEEDEENEEAQIEAALLRQQQETREQIVKQLRGELAKALMRLNFTHFIPILLPKEKEAYNKSKKFKEEGLEVLRDQIDEAKKIAKERASSNWSRILGPLLPVILIAALIIIVPIVIGMIYESNSSEEAGPQADAFYGVRAIYTDDNLSNKQLAKDYATIVTNVLDGVNTSAAAESLTATFTISFPEEFNLDTIVAGKDTTGEGYKEEYDILYAIAKSVYESDNSGETAPEDLVNTLTGIKYFGLTDTELAGVKTSLKTALPEYIEIRNAGNDLQDEKETTYINDTVDALTSDTARAEKVFIRDYSAPIGEVEKANYIALVFMPKENMTVDALALNFKGATAEFEVSYVGGSKTATAEYDEDLGKYTCEFTNINFAGVSAPDGYFADAKSLLDVNNDTTLADKSAYIVTQDGVITYVKPSSYITFDTTEAFQFTIIME